MKLSKSDIPWCDYGASPVTGCRHACEWCYARGMVRRFGQPDVPGLHVLGEPIMECDEGGKAREQRYHFGFAPTLHRYRLDAPRVRRPGRVFVCPMADLWGSWVPHAWQSEVLDACAADQRHDYLFLTKNPRVYVDHDWSGRTWAWLGATATTLDDARTAADWLGRAKDAAVRYLSLEPWLGGAAELQRLAVDVEYRRISVDWIIIGPLTGPMAARARRQYVGLYLAALAVACDRAGVALFVKPSATAWGLTPGEIAVRQAFPRAHPSEV